ncbi:MAG: rubredoxin [Arcobacter sp.]|nr:MAG: rubredoxin [Arcobacter sp.]
MATEEALQKYRCPTCDYIYDPALGDSEADIPAGTAFKDLPDDWVCPDCGERKEEFVIYDEKR